MGQHKSRLEDLLLVDPPCQACEHFSMCKRLELSCVSFQRFVAMGKNKILDGYIPTRKQYNYLFRGKRVNHKE